MVIRHVRCRLERLSLRITSETLVMPNSYPIFNLHRTTIKDTKNLIVFLLGKLCLACWSVFYCLNRWWPCLVLSILNSMTFGQTLPTLMQSVQLRSVSDTQIRMSTGHSYLYQPTSHMLSISNFFIHCQLNCRDVRQTGNHRG